MIRRFLYLPSEWTRPSNDKASRWSRYSYSPGVDKELERDKSGPGPDGLSASPKFAGKRPPAASESPSSLDWLIQQQAVTFDPTLSELHKRDEDVRLGHTLYKSSEAAGEAYSLCCTDLRHMADT